MNTSWIRNYSIIVVFGVLHASGVSAQVGWDDATPDMRADLSALRAEIAALKATVATLKAGQPQVQTIRWNMLANDIRDFLITQTANVGALRTEAATNTAAIATNASDIDGLETSDVPGLGTYLRIGTHNSKPAVIFEAANVLVVDGSGGTGGTTNGVGNLIVGYDEPTSDPADDKTGSHNLVVGAEHTYSSYGSLVAGYDNNVTGDFASVSGGRENTASASYSSVSGGRNGSASGDTSSVSGGRENTASALYSSVSGGYQNTASNWSSSVSGGRNGSASGDTSSVSGGYGNAASSNYSSVVAGYENTASGPYSSVSGGDSNTALGSSSSVSGGVGNTASGGWSSVSGGNSRSATGNYNWRAGGESEDN